MTGAEAPEVRRYPTQVAEPTSAVQQLRAENERLHMELEHALQAMAAREVIEQAKGLLMGYYRCDAQLAFALLRELSQRSNVKLRRVAVDIMDRARIQGRVDFPGIDAVAESVLATSDDTSTGPEAAVPRPSGWR
jgi:hypothetical protein